MSKYYKNMQKVQNLIKIDVDIIGNLKVNLSQFIQDNVKEFFSKYYENYILFREDKDQPGEHIHFWLQGQKFKSSQPLKTLKTYFRCQFPQYKRKGKGGPNKYNFKILEEEYQFIYMFKEKNIMPDGSDHLFFNDAEINEIVAEYNWAKKHKKQGVCGQFYLFMHKTLCAQIKSKPVKYNWAASYNREYLVKSYITHQISINKAPTVNMCDRVVNYCIMQEHPKSLINDFTHILLDKYRY